MKQSNTARRLHTILKEAISNGGSQENSGNILLKAMKVDGHLHKLLDFYELLNKVGEDARKLKNIEDIDSYILVIEQLQNYFVTNPIWGSQWATFVNFIQDKNILIALSALANYLHSQNPERLLEVDFLEELSAKFESFLNEIYESDLSKELKIYLIDRIEDILKAIRRYAIDGTEGLEKAAKSLVNDLALTEHNLKDEDKKNPIYQRVKAWGLSLVLFITPSVYDIVGAVPDIYEFWVPKFEELATGSEKIEKIIREESNNQEIIEKALDTFSKESIKSISGRELKALPASKEDVENNIANKSDP